MYKYCSVSIDMYTTHPEVVLARLTEFQLGQLVLLTKTSSISQIANMITKVKDFQKPANMFQSLKPLTKNLWTR